MLPVRRGQVEDTDDPHVTQRIPSPTSDAAQRLTLDERRPALPRSVGELRASVREHLRGRGWPAQELHRVALAVSEAAANAVVHAYRGSEAEAADRVVRLRAFDHDEELEVWVEDAGGGLRPRPDSPGLGLGLPLINTMADAVEVDAGDLGGSRVRMRFRRRG
jgi:serine/threonine-protein kinase RsbW/stage II sporulation protein AB (anti-sigma F factor)